MDGYLFTCKIQKDCVNIRTLVKGSVRSTRSAFPSRLEVWGVTQKGSRGIVFNEGEWNSTGGDFVRAGG